MFSVLPSLMLRTRNVVVFSWVVSIDSDTDIVRSSFERRFTSCEARWTERLSWRATFFVVFVFEKLVQVNLNFNTCRILKLQQEFGNSF